MNPYGEVSTRRPVTDEDLHGIKTAMRDIRASWSSLDLNNTVIPGTESAFDTMAESFRDKVQAHPATTERFQDSSALESGSIILSRFFYAGALTGALNGFTLDQTRDMLFTPTSYKTIEQLTHETNSSAKTLEFEYGMRQLNYSSVDDDPSRYVVAPDGGLIFRNYQIQRITERFRLAGESRLDYEEVAKQPEEIATNCKLNRLGGFALCYKSILDISLKDPSLIPAVLVRPDIMQSLMVE